MGSTPSDLPPQLRGPVDVALARASEVIPGEGALAGGSRYELKWDGFRLVVVHDGVRVRLWSRRGTDLTDRFPDIAAAAASQLRPGTVLDGEAVVWAGERLDFDLLQRRLVTGPARIGAPVRANHASYVAFDVLAHQFIDHRLRPWTVRRQVLQDLAGEWGSPLEVSPYTGDVDEARAWFVDYAPAGIEGLVCKGAWRAGVLLTALRGTVTNHAYSEMGFDTFPPFAADEYVHCLDTTTRELSDQPAAVVGRLMQRLLRRSCRLSVRIAHIRCDAAPQRL